MTNILLGALLASFVMGIVLGTIAARRVWREYLASREVAAEVWAEYQNIRATITEYLTPTGEGQPSPFSLTVQAMSEVAARSITASIKTTLMGQESGRARGEQAIQGQLLDAAMPGAGGLVKALGMGRTLRKNPGIIDLALGALSHAGIGGGNHNGESNDHPRFKFGG